jgi:prefoldin alpha subunit
MSEREMQEKLLRYQMLEQSLKELNERGELFSMKLMEIEQTEEAIEEIKKSKLDNVFVPLGSNVFLPGKLDKKEKMIVGIGADVALEKNIEEVKDVLGERKKTLEQGLQNVQNNMMKIAQQMQDIQREAQSLMSKTQKSAG